MGMDQAEVTSNGAPGCLVGDSNGERSAILVRPAGSERKSLLVLSGKTPA